MEKEMERECEREREREREMKERKKLKYKIRYKVQKVQKKPSVITYNISVINIKYFIKKIYILCF